MIRSYLAAIGALLLGLTAPAQAYTVDAAHQQIIDTVKAVGVRVYIDPYACKIDKVAGYYTGQVLGICTKYNHHQADFNDTIRHEAFHVAQHCEAINRGEFQSLHVISPETAAIGRIKHRAAVSRYPAEVQEVEAEAWMAASALSPQTVDKVLRRHCFFAF